MKIKRVAIANRGEVAVRIIRACQELGLETILLHSEPDTQSRAYRLADFKICIGAGPSADSYLNIDRNIQGALAMQADAIHPGFGFLSENPNFAKACLENKIIFIGPSPQAMKALGDKVECKKIARGLGLPLIPGYEGSDQSIDRLSREALNIGFPVIVKAAAGGGGRGMKVISEAPQSAEQIESAQREAQSAFGNPQVFLEKYFDRAKHIEFQVFVDCSGHAVHLFERECSVQRRHQKIVEEALSPTLSPQLRSQMSQAACLLVEKANYRGAGTVEFLVQDQKFFLLEVNTRLQVEHTVTEEVMGVDLVKAQILTAGLEPVFNSPWPLSPQGHSIECRIYAENPYNQGAPDPGLLGSVVFPEGPGRRFEYGFESGDEITSFYDPMIAKIIVWDETRPRALQKLMQVLKETIIFGVHTNIPLLKKIIDHPDFVNGRMTTQFMNENFSEFLTKPSVPPEVQQAVQRMAVGTPWAIGTSPLISANPFAAPWRSL